MPETKTRLDKRTKGLIPASQFYAVDTGAANAYVMTLSEVPTAYETGRLYSFLATNANTGTSTVNINSLGAKTIKKNTSSNLSAGDIAAGQLVLMQYDGTNMQLISTFPGAGSSGTGGFNNVSSTVYDSENRLIQFIADTLTYDLTWSGHTLTAITNGSNTWTGAFNTQGQLTSITQS